MGTVSAHLSEDLEALAKSAAVKKNRGKMSAYIADLIERDVSNAPAALPTAKTPTCLVDLAEQFIPTWVPEVRQRVEGVDQPKVLEIILKLYASEELGLRDVWLREQYPAKDVAMAAEEVAKYGAKKKASTPRKE